MDEVKDIKDMTWEELYGQLQLWTDNYEAVVNEKKAVEGEILLRMQALGATEKTIPSASKKIVIAAPPEKYEWDIEKTLALAREFIELSEFIQAIEAVKVNARSLMPKAKKLGTEVLTKVEDAYVKKPIGYPKVKIEDI